MHVVRPPALLRSICRTGGEGRAGSVRYRHCSWILGVAVPTGPSWRAASVYGRGRRFWPRQPPSTHPAHSAAANLAKWPQGIPQRHLYQARSTSEADCLHPGQTVPQNDATHMSTASLDCLIAENLAHWPEQTVYASRDTQAVHSPLFPVEQAAIVGVSAQRQREFAAGRFAAHAVQVKLGFPPTAIPMGEDRARSGLLGWSAASRILQMPASRWGPCHIVSKPSASMLKAWSPLKTRFTPTLPVQRNLLVSTVRPAWPPCGSSR